jgi:hypothetical protein
MKIWAANKEKKKMITRGSTVWWGTGVNSVAKFIVPFWGIKLTPA